MPGPLVVASGCTLDLDQICYGYGSQGDLTTKVCCRSSSSTLFFEKELAGGTPSLKVTLYVVGKSPSFSPSWTISSPLPWERQIIGSLRSNLSLLPAKQE